MTDQKDTKPRTGGRLRVGTVLTTRDGRLQGQVQYRDGSRKRLKPYPKDTSEAMARERTAYHAAIYAKLDRPKKTALQPTQELPETPMGRWVKAWLADRTARGYSSVRDNTSHYLLHIAPSVGPKHVRDWDRDDLRKLSRDLDAKVQSKALAWKSAINVWATATKIAGDAAESKKDDIRCRADNPATGVRGPDRGDDVGEQYLYPSEFLKFVECEGGAGALASNRRARRLPVSARRRDPRAAVPRR